MGRKAVIVFTSKSVDTMLRDGGSSCWSLNPDEVAACEYVVCSWNSRRSRDTPIPHRTAFLIGRISSFAQCERPEGSKRPAGLMLNFKEYALLNVPNIRPRRNPFEYVDDVETVLELKLASLRWRSA